MTASREERVEGHDKLHSHLQHYSEPRAPDVNGNEDVANTISGSSYKQHLGSVLDLGSGVFTKNKCGVPIVIVLTKSDRLDSIGDEMVSRGLVKGKGLTTRPVAGKGNDPYAGWNWDERVDWSLAAIRTAALMYGASVFYTTTGQPQTFSLLRQHLLHRLYSVPPPLHLQATSPTQTKTKIASSQANARFPFPFRANQLDRDAIMIPGGWDAWGKIEVLKDGFHCKSVNGMWENSLERGLAESRTKKSGRRVVREETVQDDDEVGIEQVWRAIVPDLETDSLALNPAVKKAKSANEQDFLHRQLEAILRDPGRDPRRALRHAAFSPSTPTSAARGHSFLDDRLGAMRGTPGVVGPMASDGLSMPNVEMAFAALEGGVNGVDLATPIPRRESKQYTNLAIPSASSKALSPSAPISATTASNEVLNNFFQGLIAGRKTPTVTTTPRVPSADGKPS